MSTLSTEARKSTHDKQADFCQQMAQVLRALEHGLGDKLVAVVLFGSRARGEADASSDWDLLVIAHGLPQRLFQRHLYLKRLLPVEWRSQVAIVAKTPEEFEAQLTSLFLDIAMDGVILYDRQNYMSERLARVSRLIQEQGLQRVRLGHDLVWTWERFPGFDWSLSWEMAQ